MNEKPVVRVLFVCLGNICRSPMAKAIFAHRVREAGLEQCFEVDSAGTGGWHEGSPAHSGTRKILAEHGIDSAHCARQLEPSDLQEFDYVVVMDRMNLQDVGEVERGLSTGSRKAKVVRLMEFAPERGVQDVPDPYYTNGFQEVFEHIDAATSGLLATIRTEYGLK